MCEFAFFIWAWTIVAKNSWRWPSMRLTIFTLVCLFLVFALAGVQPMSGYKDKALNKIKAAFANGNSSQSALNVSNNLITANTAVITQKPVTSLISTVTSQTTTNVKGINPSSGMYGNYYLGLANTPQGVLSGDGCYDDAGDFIVLINNKNAIDPTYTQLISFLESDTTDEYPYITTNKTLGFYSGTAESHVDLARVQKIINGTAQPGDPDICADFAERLHNDAEMDGIRCAYVSLELSIGGHAIDAFQTTDRGLIYIDDTGISSPGPTRCIKPLT